MEQSLPQPGQKKTLSQSPEQLRKDLEVWTHENDGCFQKKEGKRLEEMDHPDMSKKATGLLTALGAIKSVWKNINPSSHTFI